MQLASKSKLWLSPAVLKRFFHKDLVSKARDANLPLSMGAPGSVPQSPSTSRSSKEYVTPGRTSISRKPSSFNAYQTPANTLLPIPTLQPTVAKPAIAVVPFEAINTPASAVPSLNVLPSRPIAIRAAMHTEESKLVPQQTASLVLKESVPTTRPSAITTGMQPLKLVSAPSRLVGAVIPPTTRTYQLGPSIPTVPAPAKMSAARRDVTPVPSVASRSSMPIVPACANVKVRADIVKERTPAHLTASRPLLPGASSKPLFVLPATLKRDHLAERAAIVNARQQEIVRREQAREQRQAALVAEHSEKIGPEIFCTKTQIEVRSVTPLEPLVPYDPFPLPLPSSSERPIARASAPVVPMSVQPIARYVGGSFQQRRLTPVHVETLVVVSDDEQQLEQKFTAPGSVYRTAVDQAIFANSGPATVQRTITPSSPIKAGQFFPGNTSLVSEMFSFYKTCHVCLPRIYIFFFIF